MNNKKFSVCMSVYKNDQPDYLKLSLDSIFTQTYKDFKLLLYIDGPISEGLRDVIRSYNDERLEVIESPINKGLANALNSMLCICKDYSYIARMDADDIAMPDRFEKQMAFLQTHPEVDMVGGAINEIDESGNDRGKITRYPCEPDACRAFFAKRNPVAHPTVMFRRSFFEKTRWHYPTDFERNEDTRLWHEGYKHGCVIANIPDVVLNFRMTDSMFKNRRNGRVFYGFMAYIYAYATYLMMISPSWVLKFVYRILR